jgi:hypothetical protein
MENIYINHFAVLVCAISSLLIGAIWYSPFLFFRSWQKESGLSDAQIEKGNMLKIYGLSFLLAWIMSYNLAFFLGDANTDWQWGLTAGFLAGFGWATLMFAVIALFEQRSLGYVLINGGYITLWFTVIGFILGIWR